MSISAYVGLPGHGKSYGVVENVILPALRSHRLVFTNIPMQDEKCLTDFGMSVVSFHTEDIAKNPNWFTDVFQPGAIFVFDEVWRLWPAGLKANNVLEQHKSFLAEHRHLVGENGFSTEIYLVTQDLAQISSFARALVETTYRTVKRSNMGLDKLFRVDVYSGAVTGNKPPVSQREREIHGGKFSQDIYQYYKSHTKSETGAAGNETRTDKRYNSFGRLSIKLGFFAFILLSVFLYFSARSSMKMYDEPAAKTPTAQPSSNPDNSQSPPISQVPQKKAPPKFPAFLSAAKQISVSYSINRSGADSVYFSVEFPDNWVTLDQNQLQALSYKTTRINDCLYRVTGPDYDSYIACLKVVPPTNFAERYLGSSDLTQKNAL